MRNNGKQICKQLKAVRQKIADANHISYHPHECHYEGKCDGTCPACEAEKEYIESSLKTLRKNGFAIKVAGIAAGLIVSTLPCQAQNSVQSTTNNPNDTTISNKVNLETVDLSNGAKDTVKVSGIVVDVTGEPLVGVSIRINNRKGTVTNSNGQFSVIVPKKSALHFSYIGCARKRIIIGDQKELTNIKIVMRNSLEMTTGIISTGYDNKVKELRTVKRSQ